MTNHQHTRPRTLGLLGTGLVTVMQNHLWQGAMSAAQKYGAGLIYYPTISLSSEPPFAPQTKVLFDLVDKDSLDGLLIWHAGIAEGIALDFGERTFDRYEGMPIITIGGKVKSHPDLSVDNYQGVRAAVEHLVKVHGRRHIAMIRGPVGHIDADERYRGYVAELEAQGLPLNLDYVTDAKFELLAAAEKSEATIKRWLQDPNRQLDAVVTASDYMAIAAIKAIEAHGLRVPEDISVIGFDDVDDSQASIPSITTVRQPFYDMGYRATKMLFAVLDGQSVPDRSRVPAQLVVRESCGCTSKSALLANFTISDISGATTTDPELLRRNLLGKLRTIATHLEIPQERLVNLAALLENELNPETAQQFLVALRLCLMDSAKAHFNVTLWQDVVSVLRKYALSISNEGLSLTAQILFDQARMLVTELAQRFVIKERIEAELQIEKLRRISEGLITSFGTQLLVDTLQEHLQKLGFPSFYLSLYEDPEQPAQWSQLILACDGKQILNLPPDGLRIQTRRLVPDTAWLAARTASLVVEPLYFREQQLGILVLEVGPTEGAVYETLRTQISSALQGSRLVREIQQRAAELEQRVAERTTELTQTVELLRREIIERKQIEESLNKAEKANRTFSERLKALFTVSDELSKIDEMDQLCYKAIEFGQSHLKFDRLSLWFYDRDPEYQVGSFGTDERGNIRDERNIRIRPDPISNHLSEITKDGRRVYYRDSGDLYNDQHEIMGRGWLAVGTLIDGNRIIGILSVDNLLSLTPIEPYQLELLALYSATLGNLVTRLRAEATLRDSEERLRQVVRTGNLGIYDHDQVNETVYWSPELRSFYDMAPDEPASLTFLFNQMHPDDRERMRLAVARAYDPAGDGSFDVEYRIIVPSGAVRWQLTRSRTYFEGEGSARHAVRTIGAAMDITKHKHAEEALRESEEHARAFQGKLKALQEISFELAAIESPEQMCCLAIELGRTYLGYDRIGLLVYDNPQKTSVSRFGIESSGELRVERGMPYTTEDDLHDSALINRESVQISEDADLRNFEGDTSIGRGWNIMAGIRDASASIGWLAADNFFERQPLKPYQFELLNLYGLTLGHLLTRKRAEAEIRKLNDELEQRVIARTKQLEEANHEIRHFVYIVSHDLRAPLVNLKGFSGELRSALRVVQEECDEVMELVNPTNRDRMMHAIQEDIPEALKFIESAVDNMDSFTKAILKLSRLGRLQLELVTIDTRSIVDKTLENLSYQIRQQGIKVTIGDLPTITADFLSMEQIFGNILSNAVAYLVPGRPGEIKVTAEHSADRAIISIQDNGRGIASDDMEKVFAPFRRAGKQDVPGEGMGMAYVQTLVRRHGGSIWCDSESGVGTTFTFTIPDNVTSEPNDL